MTTDEFEQSIYESVGDYAKYISQAVAVAGKENWESALDSELGDLRESVESLAMEHWQIGVSDD